MSDGSLGAGVLAPLLSPRSVAVVGVGRRGIGRLIIDHLESAGFAGDLFVVAPRRGAAGGSRHVPDLDSLEVVPDLVIVVVGVDEAVVAVRAAASKGCGAAIVVSAGFAEVGERGLEAQRAMVASARAYGMRLLGPNCMGLINTSPDVRLHASFGVAPALRGPLALISQSGSVADYVLYHAHRWGLGVSIVASVGNEADVTAHELLRAAAADAGTGVVGCYFEQPAEPQALVDAIREASRSKPVVVIRGGRSFEGRRAAVSHTGRMAASTDGVVVDSLLVGAGATVVTSLEELMAACVALARHPGGCGRRIAVLTNAGGPGVLAVDEVTARGWELVDGGAFLSRSGLLPDVASAKGPVVDLTASARAEHFRSAASALVGRADALLCLIMSPEGIDPSPAVEALVSSWSAPLALCLLARGASIDRAAAIAAAKGVPVAAEPRLGVAALTAVMERSSKARSPRAHRLPDDVGTLVEAEARGEILRRATSLSGGLSLCRRLGMPVASFRVAKTLDEVEDAACSLGFPVVLKVDLPSTVHKTDVGAVSGPIHDERRLHEVALSFLHRTWALAADGVRVVVQKHVEGVELIVGACRHGDWGHVIVVGVGGAAVEALDAVAYLAPTASEQDVVDALRSMKASAIFDRHRGQPPVDLGPVARAAVRIGALASRAPIIYEIEVNPFMAARGRLEAGGVVDVRVVLEKSASDGDPDGGGR